MKRMIECVAKRLRWEQPHALRSRWVLLDGADLVAALRLRQAIGSLATLEGAEGSWSFKHVGLAGMRVAVRELAVGAEVARLVHDAWRGGGTLALPGGREVRSATNLWQTRHVLTDRAGEDLIRFGRDVALKASCEVDILPAAANVPELPWLVGLGWYSAMMLEAESGVYA